MAKSKWYVGVHRKEPHNRSLFSHMGKPTEREYPYFLAVIGPFRTKRGAEFMRDYGSNNPHCQTVEDAERLAKVEGYKNV